MASVQEFMFDMPGTLIPSLGKQAFTQKSGRSRPMPFQFLPHSIRFRFLPNEQVIHSYCYTVFNLIYVIHAKLKFIFNVYDC